MGMFDYIVCKYKLPGDPPDFVAKDGYTFQTKDLECCLYNYTIYADGTFSDPSFTGSIVFYTSNIVGSDYGVYTSDGSDAISLEYKAEIVRGKLLSLIETEYTVGPALPIDKMKIFVYPQKENNLERIAEKMKGKQFYVLTHDDNLFPVTVVAENEHQICVQKENGDFDIMNKSFIDHLLWNSLEEAEAYKKARKEFCDTQKAEWDRYVKEWNEKYSL